MSRHDASLADFEFFPPTVEGHTRLKSGIRFHTIDPDPERDVETWEDREGWTLVRQRGED